MSYGYKMTPPKHIYQPMRHECRCGVGPCKIQHYESIPDSTNLQYNHTHIFSIFAIRIHFSKLRTRMYYKIYPKYTLIQFTIQFAILRRPDKTGEPASNQRFSLNDGPDHNNMQLHCTSARESARARRDASLPPP